VTALEWLSAGSLARLGRVVVYLEFALAAIAMVYLAFHLFSDVFDGSPRALPVHIDASCQATRRASSCSASIILSEPPGIGTTT